MAEVQTQSQPQPQQEYLETTEKLLGAMEGVLDDFIFLLQEENEALRGHDRKKVVDLVPKKDKLSQIYEAQLRRISQDEELFDFVDDDRKKRLEAKTKELAPLMEENARLLKVMIVAGEEVQNIVVNIAKSFSDNFQTYDGKGDKQSARFTKNIPVSLQKDI